MSVYIPKGKDGKAKSPYYHFDFKLRPAGSPVSRRFHGSTGQKTQTAARSVEARVKELAALGKLGNLTTLGQACDRYWKEVGKRARTPQARRQQHLCMDELKTYYGEETPLVAISPDDVAKAVTTRSETPVCRWKKVGGELLPMPTGKMPAAATVNRQVVQPLRRVLRRAKIHWKVPIDLEQFQWGGQDGVMLQEPEERVRELTAAEELRFWPALDPDYHLICELYIISGRRQSNWLMLPKFNIDLEAGTVRMRKLKKRGEAHIVVDLTDRELEIVREAWHQAPGCEYLFTAPSKRPRDRGARRPITQRMLYDHVSAAFRRAGISDIRPHDFRHTFGSRALRADPNLKKLMQSMDHDNIASTMRYAHVLQSEVRAMRANVQVNKVRPDNVRVLNQRLAK